MRRLLLWLLLLLRLFWLLLRWLRGRLWRGLLLRGLRLWLLRLRLRPDRVSYLRGGLRHSRWLFGSRQRCGRHGSGSNGRAWRNDLPRNLRWPRRPRRRIDRSRSRGARPFERALPGINYMIPPRRVAHHARRHQDQ